MLKPIDHTPSAGIVDLTGHNRVTRTVARDRSADDPSHKQDTSTPPAHEARTVVAVIAMNPKVVGTLLDVLG
jgi:hypothetical protein